MRGCWAWICRHDFRSSALLDATRFSFVASIPVRGGQRRRKGWKRRGQTDTRRIRRFEGKGSNWQLLTTMERTQPGRMARNADGIFPFPFPSQPGTGCARGSGYQVRASRLLLQRAAGAVDATVERNQWKHVALQGRTQGRAWRCPLGRGGGPKTGQGQGGRP